MLVSFVGLYEMSRVYHNSVLPKGTLNEVTCEFMQSFSFFNYN